MTCAYCNGSGHLPGNWLLDCTHCDAATERYALDLAITKITAEDGPMDRQEERWEAYRLGKAAAIEELNKQKG